ncbi:type III-B CRISPR module RAMP protein Cmr6 [Prosthecobacter sp.]|jgi:CRISPR-associated protein Cmr6|uniref:type III-B CRISPR module RAMP protein Cmr6 n=1 Tax=Prosthecobacter sp. TaxID=1965333 RepID=UPI003783F1E3
MIHLLPSTRAVIAELGKQPPGRKAARTLAASRYIDFPSGPDDKNWRRQTSTAIKDGSIKATEKLNSWRSFALDLAGPEKEKSPRLLFARQQSRLLMNMAGGVFENGGLSLDRLSGLPVIPGSAVKGCARRLALAALQEWTIGQLQPEDPQNILSPVIQDFKDPAEMLLQIALVFGWSDLEWQGRDDFDSEKKWLEKRPDFAWACDTQWDQIREAVVPKLLKHLHLEPKPDHAAKPWKSLPHFAGTIAFLPAYPWEKDPGIDLDVITCHHPKYYNQEAGYEDAPDTEEPVPVIFPAIAPGQTWAFLLHPTCRAKDSHLTHARRWLAHGLETFGIGAKTNAGYGWFEVPDLAHEKEELAKKAAETAKKAAEAEAEAANYALRSILPDASVIQTLQSLRPDQLRAVINKFTVDKKWWPKLPAPEAVPGYHLALLEHLTQKDRQLYETEKSRPNSKIITALQELARLYARQLPD